jgi:RNA polymerase sigma factor (sigma-70 family)
VPEEGSVTALLILLHSDDPDVRNRAAAELLQRYAPQLLELIAGRMQQRLQQRVAPEDVLQDVLLSFCKRQQSGGFDLENRDQFLNLLVTIALNKVCSAARREFRQRRDLRREQPLTPDNSSVPDRPDPRAAAPDAAAQIAEEIELLLSNLPIECREVAILRLEGQTVEEIARKVDRTPRTVERRLERIRALWGEETPES